MLLFLNGGSTEITTTLRYGIKRKGINWFCLDGFPYDFSILAAFRVSGRSRGELFTIYSADGSLSLSVKVAKRFILIYKDDGGDKKSRIRFQFKLKENT